LKEKVSLDSAATHILEECRMVLPGIQALFGFQLIAVFNEGFAEKLSSNEQLRAWTQEKQTAQQQRMKDCNVQASKKELKGEERKAFMSGCLSGEKQLTAQQQRMKDCNVQAGKRELKGEQRREFMSECLSG
jgi:hypothetical protein